MIMFILGLVVGGVSGGLTLHSTGDGSVAAVVGIICCVLVWVLGVFLFTDGDGFDIDF